MNADWSSAPGELNLEGCDVHVWRAFLDSQRSSLDQFERVLSEDERTRASRFVFPRDRQRFVVGRGILRFILGLYTRHRAADVPLVVDAQGKPTLPAGDRGVRTCFNVSHSQDVVVYAVARGREVGVDIEAVRGGAAWEEIAKYWFSPVELDELRKLPPERRAEGFFLCWTRKEAYLKALGVGLATPLDGFSVSLTPGKPASLRSHDAARWKMYALEPCEAFVGCLVVEGGDAQVRTYNWGERVGG